MILQSLAQYYEDQVELGKISKPGWSKVKVSFALRINSKGDLIDIVNLKTETEKGNKKILTPREMLLPTQPIRTSGVAASFLCDNSSYFLGVSEKKEKDGNKRANPEKDIKRFEESRRIHERLLTDCSSPGAVAVLCFFRNWKPENAKENPLLKEYWEDITNGANLIFRYDDIFIHEINEIANIWNKYYQTSEEKTVESICLITGKNAPVEAIHPLIKGIKGAQTSGAALVSFNAPAFCSYGKEQNYNAPTSKYAAFAYTTALNTLISDWENVNYIGDTAVLCWAEGGEDEYKSLANMSLFGTEEAYSSQDIMDKMRRISEGKRVEFHEKMLDPQKKFYVLGIAPNAARLSVRFFWQNSFGNFMKNIEEHYRRLEIIKPDFDAFWELPLRKILFETVNQKSEKKAASPIMAGQLLEAILTNGRYPATLINYINIRIKADHKMNRCRAAIIKAYYLKNQNKNISEEVLKVALNRETANVPYNLGRLFSILENIQQKANPGVTSTITDKYFNSASATPATVFPILLNLAQKHLRKIGGGLQVVLSKEMQEVIDKLGEGFPRRMNLEQQGAFQLGYYHQTQERFQSKDKEEK